MRHRHRYALAFFTSAAPPFTSIFLGCTSGFFGTTSVAAVLQLGADVLPVDALRGVNARVNVP